MEITLTSTHLILFILAYLLGSIPFGLVIGKFAKIGDIRQSGSGNIGATNMTRVGGKKLGLAVLILDALKGVAAILIAAQFSDFNTSIWCGLAAILGHIFPIWLKFKGGKGVATALASYTILMWQLGVSILLVWLAIFLITRISSLSAIFAMLTAPILAFFLSEHFLSATSLPLVYFSVITSVIVIARHHQNIKNLLQKKEGNFKDPQ